MANNLAFQFQIGSLVGRFVGRSEDSSEAPTCANKHDVILAVLCLHAVHHNLCQLVRNIGLHEHGLAQGGIHGPPHKRVVPGKLQHRIREVLRASELSARLVGDFTWALKRPEAEGSVTDNNCAVPDFG